MAKILISDKLAREGIEVLKAVESFEVDIKVGLPPSVLESIIKDYDAIIIRSQTKLTADILQQARNLKVIGRAGVGLDNVDVGEATRRGIIVMNAPSGNTISTCEHTFALMLSLSRNIPSADRSLREGRWERAKFKGTELYGKTLGVIGLGRIGKEVAQRAQSFGMRVICYDPFISEEVARQKEVELVELDRLLKESDYITIHTPLTSETKNLISWREFSLMKPQARIINCARGGIINEEALAESLQKGRISGAALDVYTQEPPLPDSPLFSLPDTVFTPHLGASTEEAQINVAIEIAKCVRDALLGRGFRNAVNAPSLEPEIFEKLAPYISLGEKLGLVGSQLIKGRITQVIINYMGEITQYKLTPLTLAILKGILSPVLEETVNFVNSLGLARQRGIKLEEIKSTQESDYLNSLTLEIVSNEERLSLEGALFANQHPRLVRFNDYYLEAIPSGYMVFVFNIDRPGVIGRLGSILGKHSINIASMSFGRKSKGGEALTILNVDNPLTPEIIEEILSSQNIQGLKFIKV